MKKIKEISGVLTVLMVAFMVVAVLKLSAAQYVVNIGPFPDSNIGDTEWTGFQKMNSNFTELYGLVGSLAGGSGTNANTLERYGAVGDGVTDDYSAFTNAVLSTASGVGAAKGGIIYIGPKTYRIGSPVSFSNLRSIYFQGVDPERSKLVLDISGGTVVGINFVSTTNTDGVIFENIGLGGANNSDTSPWDNVQFGDGWSNVRFVNCYVNNARHSGVRWSGAALGRYALFRNCRFWQINSPAMTAQAGGMILGSPVSDLVIDGCYFELIGTNRSTMQAAYLVGIGNTLTNWSIVNSTFVGTNARPHAYGGSSYNGVFSGNKIRSVQGVTMDSVNGLVYSGNSHSNSTSKFSSDGVTLSGNQYINGTIQVTSGNNVVISGNGMTNAATQAITIDGTSPVTISGNTIQGGSTAAIALNAGSGHRLIGNAVSTFAESPLLLTGTVSNVFSFGNIWKITSGAGSGILKNDGTGIGNVSERDSLESSSTSTVTGFTLRGSLRRGYYSNYVGKVVLVGGTATVTNNIPAATSNILLARQVTGGTVGHLTIGAIVPGVSFVVSSSSGTDTSTVGYQIVEE